ncbi:MAG: MBL fold metallo-hydrolase [Desulfuromonadales bacterium]
MQQHTVQTPYIVGEAHFYSIGLNDGGLALFDTGPSTPEAVECLRECVDLARLKYLFITHCHVDHYGLANFVLENSAAEVYIPRTDSIKLKRHIERVACIGALLNYYGFSDDFAGRLRASFDRNKIFPVSPERYRIAEESSELQDLGVSWLACPGHTQSDLVYLVGEYAVTGDILLRNIFQAPLLDTDLETFEGRFRNYEAYSATLIKLAQLRGKRIMPGHRQFVGSVDEAILFYVKTLLERATQLLPLKRLAVNEIIDRLFRGRHDDPFFVYLKISEIVFMLDFIENPALLKTSLDQIGLFDQVCELYSAFV